MTKCQGVVLAAAILFLLGPAVRGAETQPAIDPGTDLKALAAKAQTALAARCAECHGSQLARPKGKPPFGKVDDLVALAANKKAVDCMLRWSFEQGLSHRMVAPEELFAPGTMQDL